MTPKEKAKNLVEKMCNYQWRQVTLHRSCSEFVNACNSAIVVCDEFLAEMNCQHIGYGKQVMFAYRKKKTEYWQQVKAEIEKL